MSEAACTCLYSPECAHDPPRGPSGRPDCPPGCECFDCVRRVDEFERAQIAVVDGRAWRSDESLIREAALTLARAPRRASRAGAEHARREGDPDAALAYAFGSLHYIARHVAGRLLRSLGEELPEEEDDGTPEEQRPTIPCPPPVIPDPPESAEQVARVRRAS